MDLFIRHISKFISTELRRQERNFLSELRLTEAIVRSDINDLNTKVESLLHSQKQAKAKK